MGLSAKGIFRPAPGLSTLIERVIAPAVRSAGDESAQLLQATSQGYAPVDTGALRDSITTTFVQDGAILTWRVGPSIFYSIFLEYGTGQKGDPDSPFGHVMSWPGQRPQPYQRPAYDELKDQIVVIFRETLAAAL